MKLQRLMSLTRKALQEYDMIEDGDKICVGVSGGKDSLALLKSLHGIKRFYPKKYELCAISVDLGFGIQNFDKITDYCNEMEIPLYIVKTEIGDIVFKDRKEKSPCSLCAKMRKGALNEKAKELGCNKIAYAHHKDDIIETLMLSLIFESRIHTFSPVTYLDRMQLTLIRPLMYVNERDVIGFANKYELPVAKNPCPADGYTKRQYVKELLSKMNHDNPGCKDRMFTAILSGNISGFHL
ncbi:ATP-binding protein [uncultured Eubacterium sp.]|uniref:tRNA 2-thiocytidine biosynthesis TtcA family protein n=1 Tax=uncultured Eubacterium sp. TaxID=165185 RepID=UPI0025997E01|nr:ATP-binding protein [uncultured Eubacterium sp.]